MPTPTARRSARSQAALPAEVQAQLDRTAAAFGEVMTQIALSASSGTEAPAAPAAVPDAVAQDQTGKKNPSSGNAEKVQEAGQPNRETRRALDKQARAEEAEQRSLLAQVAERNGKQLLPHYVTAGLLGLAAAIHTLALQAHAASAAALLAGVAIAGTGAAGIWLLKRRQELFAGWQMWAAMLSTATAVWMVVAVLHGVTWGTFAAGLALEYSFGARWWRTYRHEQPTGLFDDLLEEVVEPDAAPDVEISPEQIALYPRRWAEKIGCSGGALAGSQLVGAKEFGHGIEYILKLVGGKQDLPMVLSVLSKIASGLEHPSSRLIAEPFLDEDGEENPALVKFTVVTSSPVKEDIFFREPIIRRGYIPIGPYFDGRGMAAYQVFKKKRMLNGLVVGGTGSGKSRLLELIGLVCMWTGYIHVIHADGMNGTSCPMLWEHTEHYGRDDADLLLDRLEAMQAHREEALAKAKKSGFRPSREFPGVLVIMDEAHRMITDKNWPRWCNLAREINKLGMGIIGSDQDAKLSTWRDGTMRASLQAGNGIGLRIKDRAAGQIMDSGGFNLFDLPKTPGVGFVMESDDPGARQAPYRGQFLPDADDAHPEDEDTGIRAAERQVPADVVLIEDWYAQAATRHAPLDRGTREAKEKVRRRTGPGGTGPGRSSAGSGTSPAGTAGTSPSSDASRTTVMPMPTVAAPAAAPMSGPAGMPTVAPPAAAHSDTATSGTAQAAEGEDRDTLNEAEQRILAAVREGLDQPGLIAAHLDYTRQYVATGLKSLTEKGLIDKSGNGKAVRYEAINQVA